MSKPKTQTPDNQTEPTSQVSGAVPSATTYYSTPNTSAQVSGVSSAPATESSSPAAATAKALARWGINIGQVQPFKGTGERNDGKARVGKEWVDRSDETPEALDQLFASHNIGAILGSPVYDADDGAFLGHLVDTDIDSDEGVLSADVLYPDHQVSFGRKSKGRTHLLNVVTDLPEAEPFEKCYSHGGLAVEFRAQSNTHTVMPGSFYADQIEWYTGGPERLREVVKPTEQAVKMVQRISAAMLAGAHMRSRLGHQAPGEEDYTFNTMALCGALLSEEWTEEEGVRFVRACRAVARAVTPKGYRDDEAFVRGEWRRTADKRDKGKEFVGFGTLKRDFLGDEVAKKFAKWLNFTTHIVPIPASDLKRADNFITESYRRPEGRTIHFWRQKLYVYNGAGYGFVDYQAIERDALEYLDQQWKLDKNKNLVPNAATMRDAGNLRAALERRCYIDIDTPPGSWLEPRYNEQDQEKYYHPVQQPDNAHYLCFTNGILKVTVVGKELRREFQAPDCRFFTPTPLDYAYDPSADCPLWKNTVLRQFGEDVQRLIQKMLGILLVNDTSLQKVFALIGEPGTGKSLIEKVIEYMVGEGNTCSPDSDSFRDSFGKSQLIDKSVVFINEQNTTGSLAFKMTEILKTLSGQDRMSINQKNRDYISVRLQTQAVLVNNDYPEFPDDEGAMERRLVFVPFTDKIPESQQDETLPARLKGEIAGICNWALKGYELVQQEGLQLPKASVKMRDRARRRGSPMIEFVHDHCTIDENQKLSMNEFYQKYREVTDYVLKLPSHKVYSKPKFEQRITRALKSEFGTKEFEEQIKKRSGDRHSKSRFYCIKVWTPAERVTSRPKGEQEEQQGEQEEQQGEQEEQQGEQEEQQEDEVEF